MRRSRLSLLAALSLATLVSCGGDSPGRSAPFRKATAADPVLRKGGDPVGSLPSHVVHGEVAAFKPATTADAGIPKIRDDAGSLPSNLGAGKSAVYRPPPRAAPTAVARDAGRDTSGDVTVTSDREGLTLPSEAVRE